MSTKSTPRETRIGFVVPNGYLVRLKAFNFSTFDHRNMPARLITSFLTRKIMGTKLEKIESPKIRANLHFIGPSSGNTLIKAQKWHGWEETIYEWLERNRNLSLPIIDFGNVVLFLSRMSRAYLLTNFNSVSLTTYGVAKHTVKIEHLCFVVLSEFCWYFVEKLIGRSKPAEKK